MQGPSLLLASSLKLTNEDLARIQRLGDSKKKEQFSKAGRFGVGLNALYHLTDCPQIFVDGVALVVLDPLHRVFNSDGKRFAPEALTKHFPSMLEPFGEVGRTFPTIFRLPLRVTASEFGRPFSVDKTRQVLDRFVVQAHELLLFAKHVQRVRFGVRTEGQVRILSDITRNDGPTRFMRGLPNTFDEVMALQSAPREAIEEVTIVQTDEREVTETSWLIAHSLAVETDAGAQLIHDAIHSNSLALLPHGAVALCLSADERPEMDYHGNVAAFLPIVSSARFQPAGQGLKANLADDCVEPHAGYELGRSTDPARLLPRR